MGYRYITVLQIVLTAVLLFSLPLWKGGAAVEESKGGQGMEKALSLQQIVRIPGARGVASTFLCHCAIRQTVGLWASNYLMLYKGVSAEAAAGFAGLFFIGIIISRGFSGFLTIKLHDVSMVRLGEWIILIGVTASLLPFNENGTLVGLILIDLGYAPIYPRIIHATPANFGVDRSQAIIGAQMVSAYVGTCFIPPLFGLIANDISVALLPLYLLVILAPMFVMHESLLKGVKQERTLTVDLQVHNEHREEGE